jgi:hypothetical protein
VVALSALALISVISACGSAGPARPQASARPSTGAVSHSAGATSASDDGLTGFGATMAAWNAHHRNGSAYSNVTPQDGRVVEYTVTTGSIPIAAAIERAKAELPADSRETWVAQKGNCYQVELTSSTVGHVLGDPAIGDPAGGILAIISTLLPDGSSVYHPAAVNQVMLSPGTYSAPADAPDC